MGIGLLIQRLKLRIPSRRKAGKHLPVLTWEEIDNDARAALIEHVEEEAEEDLFEFERSLRNPN